MPGPANYKSIDPATGDEREYAGGLPNQLATLDAAGRQPLAQDAIRAWQVIRAARPVLVNAGGSWSGFLSSNGASNPDATDGSYEAVQGGVPAPIGGVLATLISGYLTGVVGQTSAQAASAIASIWTSAAVITP